MNVIEPKPFPASYLYRGLDQEGYSIVLLDNIVSKTGGTRWTVRHLNADGTFSQTLTEVDRAHLTSLPFNPTLREVLTSALVGYGSAMSHAVALSGVKQREIHRWNILSAPKIDLVGYPLDSSRAWKLQIGNDETDVLLEASEIRQIRELLPTKLNSPVFDRQFATFF